MLSKALLSCQVRTLLGRQRLVDKVYTQAVNSVIQGSAADLVKVAMARVARALRRSLAPPPQVQQVQQAQQAAWVAVERRCRLVNMLHDELM